MGQRVEKAFSYKTVFDEAEAAIDLTDPIWTNDDFLDHGLRPPWVRSLNRKKGGNLSSPSLQEMGRHLESENICRISRPSLQDPLWQESGSKSPVLQDNKSLTRPSLQDCPLVSGPDPSAGVD